MNVLTPENTSFDMDLVTEHIPEEMYCVLDLSPNGESDFYFRHILNTVSLIVLVLIFKLVKRLFKCL